VTRSVITNIQILRFIAAGCILLTHSADLLIPHSSIIFDFPWGAGVDLFFVISGFIMTWLTWGRFGEQGMPVRFLLRRAIRIVPPYWFFTTVMIAAVLVAPGQVRWTTLGLPQIVSSYTFFPWPRPTDGKLNPILSQGWTLNYEAFFYVAFAVALCFRNGLRWLVAAFVGLAVLHYVVPPEMFVLRFYSNPIILEFVAGIGIAHLYIRGLRVSVPGSIAIAGVAGLTYVAMTFLPPLDDARFLELGLSAAFVVSSFALVAEATRQGRLRRVLRSAGDASYTLYLSHAFTAQLVAVVALRYWHGSRWWPLALAVTAATAIAMLFYRSVERPTTEALSRLFNLSRPNEAQTVAP
jgi:exopolysaccharide production protein ExoZ